MRGGRAGGRPDVLGGLGLAALIGLPGLGFGSGAAGGAAVEPAELYDTWRGGDPCCCERRSRTAGRREVRAIGRGHPTARLRVSPVAAGGRLELLRGLYHLYQGGRAGGGLAMGLVFGYVYHRTGRLWPLIIAHALIDGWRSSDAWPQAT